MSTLQEIQDFLLVLRDNYDFLIPVDRLKLCISCVTDITDVEEVLFRLQSLVCRNELQIETFHSLFAQRFLGIAPKPIPGRGGERPGEKHPPVETLESIQQRANTLSARIEEDTEKRQNLLDRINAISKQQRTLQEELVIAQDKISRMSAQKLNLCNAANSRPKSERVQKAYNEICNLLERSGFPKPVVAEVYAALNKMNDKRSMEQLTQKLLQYASKARSANQSKLYTNYLTLIPLLKKYGTIFDSDRLSAEERKTIKDLDKEISHQKKMKKASEEKQSELNRSSYLLDREYNTLSTRLFQMGAEMETIEQKLVIKESAKTHRSLFIGGVNAVQTTAEQAELMKTPLNRMCVDERNLILSYIRSNARVFRQTLRRKSTTPRRHQVDVRNTIRVAARTNGEPIDIRYKKPKKSHAKVVILTDISGSCREASTLALYFMGLMDDAFPGGCRKYAFVNHLIPVDGFFRDRSADEGVAAVLDNVPTRGVYSNYGATLHELREDVGGTVHKDTTVIILGDARNNKNQSAVEDLKYIADRCHKVYWLNPDNPSKWNTGDSIIGQYQAVGAEAYPVQTVGDLIEFLGNLSLHNS